MAFSHSREADYAVLCIIQQSVENSTAYYVTMYEKEHSENVARVIDDNLI